MSRQNQSLKLIENGVDRTPTDLKPPPGYSYVGESQSLILRKLKFFEGDDDDEQPVKRSASIIPASMLRLSSVRSFRDSSIFVPTTIYQPMEEMPIENLFSSQASKSTLQSSLIDFHEDDKPPSQFHLERYDSSMFRKPPETVKIILKETETFVIFEMPSKTEDLRSPAGLSVKISNERYQCIINADSDAKTQENQVSYSNSETQTPIIYMKDKSTNLKRKKLMSQATFVNNWVLYDEYKENKETLKIIHDEKDSLQPQDGCTMANQLCIFNKPNFKEAVRLMLRILASNTYLHAQKRFLGLIQQDPFSLDLEFTYCLELLWEHSDNRVKDRIVTSFSWNPVNKNVLAVGYGPFENREPTSDTGGALLIWCAKNPKNAERYFHLDNPVSALDWSRERPNLIAVGFYNGAVQVLDISGENVVIIRDSTRKSWLCYEPHWNVQWWPNQEDCRITEDKPDFCHEQIFTSNQDGRILCYQTDLDFEATEMMKISRVHGNIPGVERTLNYSSPDLPLCNNPAALVLRRHPTRRMIYFVGSDEGCIYRLSTNYLRHHKDSFLAHDGPVYAMEFSPFCPDIFLTCGADWYIRIWINGIKEPLLTFTTQMACVRGAVWCPVNSSIFASIVDNTICLWDIQRKTHEPVSKTDFGKNGRFVSIQFTSSGRQLLVSNVRGSVYVYNLEGMPFPPYDQKKLLVESIEKALVGKRTLLEKFKKRIYASG